MSEKYAHRNGEMEPPTIAGRYWCKGVVKIATDTFELSDTLYLAPWHHHSLLTKIDSSVFATIGKSTGHPLGEWDCQWWGPVKPPWQAE